MLALVLAGFGPAAGVAQTPVDATPIAATPQPGPEIQVVILGDTGNLPPLAVDGTPAPLETAHRLARVTVQPGFGFRTDGMVTSTVIAVESGSVVVSTVDHPAVVDVDTGGPILTEDGSTMICQQGLCEVKAGQAIVLGPGNAITTALDEVHVRAVGNVPAVLTVSVVFDDMPGLCWICPTESR
jgi:hypothetical protein